MQNDLAHGAAQSGADREQAEFLRAEMGRARARVDGAQLRSPIDGIVVTPALGKHCRKTSGRGRRICAGARSLRGGSAGFDFRARRGVDESRRERGDQAGKLSATNLAGPCIGGKSRGNSRRWRAYIYRSGASIESRREFAGRNDGAGEDFAGFETSRLRTAAASGAVDLANTLELDWLVMA